ncbi:hypothetical protein SCHPADRAFT_940869 [Schizopora paradoxa]|uniref:F-box domain-containing protein n=1 Tax=Schizopora paradoxa TaxID=27342 RepID=A0A0H2RMW6_9AGAM|nr:hypothetical protein SCHPADRAFT_940869 [Schizopora paradoxa]
MNCPQIQKCWTNLSIDVLRLIFEFALEPYPSSSNANLLCICSTVTAWLEPLLYEEIVLAKEIDYFPFIEALHSPSSRFPTRHVKKLWLLSRFPAYSGGLKSLTQRCPNLEQLVCRSFWLSNMSTEQGSIGIYNDKHKALRKLYVMNTNLSLEYLSPCPLRLLTHLHISEFCRLNYGTLQNLILPHAAELVSLTHLCIEVRLMYPYSDFEAICAGFGFVKRLFGDEGILSLQVIILRISTGFENDLPEPQAFEKTRKFFAMTVDDGHEGEGRRKRVIVEGAALSGDFTLDGFEKEMRKPITQVP